MAIARRRACAIGYSLNSLRLSALPEKISEVMYKEVHGRDVLRQVTQLSNCLQSLNELDQMIFNNHPDSQLTFVLSKVPLQHRRYSTILSN